MVPQFTTARAVQSLHGRGFPDHRIASKLRIPLSEVVRTRRSLNLTAHPADSRLTIEQVHAEMERWNGFIWGVARRWAKSYPGLDLDDLHSVAVAGFLRGGESFDPRTRNKETGKPLQITTYCDHWMRNYLQKYVAAESSRGFSGADRNRIAKIPLASIEAISQCDGERPWEPGIEDSEEDAERNRMSSPEWWERRTAVLTDQERKLIFLRYRDGLTWDQIEWATSKEAIMNMRRTAAQAVEKMRAAGEMD